MKARDIEFEKSVGRRVRELREELGWSQQHLADIADIEKNQVQRIENAKNTPSLAILTAISAALGKQPYELLQTHHQIEVNTNLKIAPEKTPVEATKYVIEIAKSSFLNSPKTVSQIVAECEELYGVEIRSSATSAILKKLVDDKIIKRLPAKITGRFVYQKYKN